jgi:colicin import membrane protein
MVAVDKTDPAPKTSQFAVAMRGYNQHQVDERVTKLAADLKNASHKRDEAMATVTELSKALSYAQRELADAKAGLVRMTSSPSGASAMAERVRMMMQLAEEEIAELKAKAEEDAAATRAEADKEAHATRRAAEKAAKDAQAEHEAELEAARAENERQNREAAELRDKLDTEARQRREGIEKKALDELEAKKAEILRSAAAEEAEAKDRLGKLVSDAENRRAVAEEQANQALEFRRKVTERLTATNTAMQEALKYLVPADANGNGAKPSPNSPNSPNKPENNAKTPQNAG